MPSTSPDAGSPHGPARQPRQRILVEDPDPAWQDLVATLLDPTSYELDFCPGPRHLSGGCPLLGHRPCPKAAWADQILCSLDVNDPENATVVSAHRQFHPDTPVNRLEGDPPRWSTSPSGNHFFVPTPSPDDYDW